MVPLMEKEDGAYGSVFWKVPIVELGQAARS